MSQVEQIIRKCFTVTDKALIDRVAKDCQIKTIKKGQYFARYGEIISNIAFLVSGLFRFFFLDAEGNELTDCFAYQVGDPVVPAIDFTDPLPINIQALEDSEVLIFPLSLVEMLIEENHEVAGIYVNMLKKSLRIHWEGKLALYQYTAAERYQWFIQNYVGLIDRVTHVHIASFLGVSPVTLSRVRSKLKSADAAMK